MHPRGKGDSELTLFGLLQCLDSNVVLICSTIQSNSAPYRHLAVASRAAAACIAQTRISIHCSLYRNSTNTNIINNTSLTTRS